MFPAILAALGKAATIMAPKAAAAVAGGGGLGGLLGGSAGAAGAAAAPTAASGLLSVPLNSTAGLGQLSTGLGQAMAAAPSAQQAAAAPQGMASKIGSSFLKGPAPEIAQAEMVQGQPVMRGRYQRMFPTPRV